MKKRIFIICTLSLFQFGMAQTAKTSLTAKKINNKLYIDYDDKNIRYGDSEELINQKVNIEESFASKQKTISLFTKLKNPITNELIFNSKTIVNENIKSYKAALSDFITYIPINEIALIKSAPLPKGTPLILDNAEFVKKVKEIISLINKTTISNRNNNLKTIKEELINLKAHLSKRKSNLKMNYDFEDIESYQQEFKIVESLINFYSHLKSWDSEITKMPFKEVKIDDISRDSIKIIKVSVINKKLIFNPETKAITQEESNTRVISGQLNFEKFRRFIPEIRAAIVFTDLSFPKFGTETNDNDEQIVAQINDEKFNKINAGLMINFNYNLGGDEFIPFFQLGVGPTKKYPILFSGLGVRINDKLMLSAGGAWTWVNQLSSLHVGNIISGTSAIDADQIFKFSTSPKLYLSLQFKL